MRKELDGVDVGAIHRRKGRRSPDASVDPPARERTHERERTVDAAPPDHVSADELFGVMRVEPRLAFAVSDLLPPIGLDQRAVVMPHEGGRGKADRLAFRLQPPAHIHIVARPEIDGIETADREQRSAAERHVAAGHVLRDAVGQQHLRGTTWRSGDALGKARIVRRHDVGAAEPTTSEVTNGCTR